ncbi:MAG: peptidoglycan-binding protein [Leptolyngbyaceae cyanobacterium CRU_2_3]|nr:peptidoglycan-binding protein [Leptolyngbyaceae cyanobacterium CRU_2_3]
MHEGDRSPRFSSPPVCPILYPWDTGPAVAELQELLCAQGFQGLRIDGDYGSKTEMAVKIYQKRHKLRIDGIVGAQTWSSLRKNVKPGSRLLHPGRVGADVLELQGLLCVCGYDVRRDGYFGEQTKAAIRSFQQQHQLCPDAIVTPVIWTLLQGRRISSPSTSLLRHQRRSWSIF